ncbi:hypothetical protein JC221_241 [Yersinia phage JC221]|nr:hypothetical protein JC221_241 [Yersinia phage JC221]
MKQVDSNICDIRPGDTVIIDGVMKTVCRNNIKRDPFLGVTLFGDSFNMGRTQIKKVIFPVYANGRQIN